MNHSDALKGTIAVFAFSVLTASIHAQFLSTPDGATTHAILRDHGSYHIQVDGRYAYEEDVVDEVRSRIGIQELGQKSISYNASMQDVAVLEAYTETVDGKHIAVEEDKIRTIEDSLSSNAPMFSDQKLRIIIFPQVVVGSKIHYHYRRTQKTPIYPGQFATTEITIPHVKSDDVQLSIFAPKAIKLHIDVTGYAGGNVACPADETDQQCYVFTTTNPTVTMPEPGSVSYWDYSSHVAVSTFSSYAEIADAYQSRATVKSKITPEIQALADSLTKGRADKAKQAELLYNWVAENIRYVAVYIGAGTVVPHDAGTVLSNRYGDCKDHVVLLEALLAAEGIASTGVLVDSANSYKLLPIAVPSFDHVITYIPSLKRYADSTAPFVPFGALPAQELGKPALALKRIDGRDQLATIPLWSEAAAHSDVKVTESINSDGGVDGKADVEDEGVFEIVDRAVLGNVPKGQTAVFASQLLAFMGQAGDGDLEGSDPRDLSKLFRFKATFHLRPLISLSGPGAFAVPTGLHSMNSIGNFGRYNHWPNRKLPVAGCLSSTRSEDYTMTLPNAMNVTALPPNVSTEVAAGKYTSQYELNGRAIHIRRRLAITVPGPVCSPAEYDQFHELATAIDKDARAQVVYH